MGSDGRVYQSEMDVSGDSSEGVDDYILVFQGCCQGVQGGIVDWYHASLAEVVVASVTFSSGQDCHLEAGAKQGVEYSWAKIASGLQR
jgi:hypothetical protein